MDIVKVDFHFIQDKMKVRFLFGDQLEFLLQSFCSIYNYTTLSEANE